MLNLIDSYLLFESYKKVFKFPIQATVKAIVKNDSRALEFLESQETLYNGLVELTVKYKEKFTSISNSLLLTTKEKEEALDKEMGKEFADISIKVKEYYKIKKENSTRFILPIVQGFKKAIDENQENFKTNLTDFVKILEQVYTVEDIGQETTAFLDSFIQTEYRYSKVSDENKDKEYFEQRGHGFLYTKALGELLKKYQLSFDMILWADLLSDELVEARELKPYHRPEEFTAYIAGYAEDYIDAFERQQVQGQKTLQELPVKKQGFLQSLFR